MRPPWRTCRSSPALLALSVLVGGVPLWAETTNQLSRAVSASRQFVAHAPGPLLPQALGVFAEQVKREWRSRLDLPDQWRDPVVIVIRERHEAATTPARFGLRVFHTEFHLKYEITGVIPPTLDQTALGRAIVEALCAEYANRNRPTEGPAELRPAVLPVWLVYGLAQSVQGRDDRLIDMVHRAVESGQPLRASALLSRLDAPADGLDRDVWLAHSWLWVEALLGLPHGPATLRRYLEGLGRGEDPEYAFRVNYATEFQDEIALQKWWDLQLVSRSSTVTAENLTVAEAGRLLGDLLETRLQVTRASKPTPTAQRVVFGELWRYARQDWLGSVLDDKLRRLQALRDQAPPAYRPVIEEYLAAIQALGDGSTVRFRRAAARADQQRRTVETQAARITAYLDQAERVYAPVPLRTLFEGYFKTFEELERIEGQRRNPISDYLDAFEQRPGPEAK